MADLSSPEARPREWRCEGLDHRSPNSGISDVLADPTLELRDGSGALLLQNDDWQDDPGKRRNLCPWSRAAESEGVGIVATLPPGASYTAILAGKNGGTGVGLVEIYDTDHGADSQLANISTRGFVQTGDNVMIGGFILGGSGSNTRWWCAASGHRSAKSA